MAGINITLNNKRTIRQRPNPLDKATIVSIYPKFVKDTKHTITPGVFEILPGTFEKPSILVVGPSSWWRDIGEEMPSIEIPNSSIQVAESVVNDYCNSMIEYVPDGASPGLFFVNGEVTVSEVKEKYSDALNTANARQTNWFDNLIRLADIGWARTNGSPNAISDLMRMAAESRGRTDKPWMKNSMESDKVKCIACGNLRNPEFPVCSFCNRVVDINLAKKLGIIEPELVPVKK